LLTAHDRDTTALQKKIVAEESVLNIRLFHSEDIEALYRISLAAGFAVGDASHLYDDPKLMGHIYSAPYALLEPELALVAVDQRGVAGFAVGGIDTAIWERRLERDWWPILRQHYADPLEAQRTHGPMTSGERS
jgi:hypothetical protein